MRWSLGLLLTALVAGTAQPVQLTAQEDRQRLMDLLGIKTLRQGANGSNPQAPNAANYDESKANPYPKLPDPLVLKNGKKVKTAKVWWKQRRPEIVEDFDREIYGRVPKVTPKVKWEVTGTTSETNGGVPVIMEFGFTSFTGAAPRPGMPAGVRAPGPTWQQQVLAKGWGYAILSPNSIQADNGQGLTQGIIGLVNKGQPRKVDDWGALRAWAWGASRALDYFETDKSVDAKRVGIEGHSRYGKATAVALAYDDRFAIAFVSSTAAILASWWRTSRERASITGWPATSSNTPAR